MANRTAEVECIKYGATRSVAAVKAAKARCERCGGATRRVPAETVRLRCGGCVTTQQVTAPVSAKAKCLKCGAKLAGAEVVAEPMQPRIIPPDPKKLKRTPKLKMRSRIKADRAQDAAEAAPLADAPGYLICPRCDRRYRGEPGPGARCETPDCKKMRLVPASSLPVRKPSERERSAGAPGTGKRR